MVNREMLVAGELQDEKHNTHPFHPKWLADH